MTRPATAAPALDPPPDVSVLVVSFNVRELLAACLRAVAAGAGPLRCEVFVVDNASPDGSADMVARDFPRVTLIRNAANRWLAPANNQGLERSRGRHILFLNPDTELLPGALPALVAFLDGHPDVGMVGAQLLNSDGSLQPSGNPFRPVWSYVADALPLTRLGLRRPRDFREPGRDYAQTRDVDEVSGACALMRREVLEHVGLLDERLAFSYEDVDLCRRMARAGWRTVYHPNAQCVHHGGRSVPADGDELRRRWERGQLVFLRKHHGLVWCAVVGTLLALRNAARRVRRLWGSI